jgi:hypothetical protein
MEYPSPFEAQWLMTDNAKKMRQLVEQDGMPSTAQDRRRAQSRWRTVLSALHIPRVSLRNLEPIKDQQ